MKSVLRSFTPLLCTTFSSERYRCDYAHWIAKLKVTEPEVAVLLAYATISMYWTAPEAIVTGKVPETEPPVVEVMEKLPTQFEGVTRLPAPLNSVCVVQ